MPILDNDNGPDYENTFLSALRNNANEVLNLLKNKDPGLIKKINTFADRTGRTSDEVIKMIQKNSFFRDVFAKDPSKQKLHENTAAAFIKNLKGVYDFLQLGHDALVVFHGRVERRRDVITGGAASTAKTIDFKWKYANKQIYASHKYTRESGGAQDNQYRDLQEFIREANESNLPNTYFLAIADGQYYQTRDGGTGRAKLERLSDIANRRNVFALTADQISFWQTETINPKDSERVETL